MGAHSLGRGHASVKGLIHAMNSTSISISDSFLLIFVLSFRATKVYGLTMQRMLKLVYHVCHLPCIIIILADANDNMFYFRSLIRNISKS